MFDGFRGRRERLGDSQQSCAKIIGVGVSAFVSASQRVGAFLT